MSYTSSKVAVDAVIFSLDEGKLQVLLHKREKDPFSGQLELIGGLLQEDEDAITTMRRKLQGIFSMEYFVEQFHTFTNPTRDPRGRVVSIGFIALIKPGTRPSGATWFNVKDIQDLAFDHQEIIVSALAYLKQNISARLLRNLLPDLFPLNLLQRVYEVVEEKKYDNRNFRKKIKNSGMVEVTDQLETNVSHRPAKLCKFI